MNRRNFALLWSIFLAILVSSCTNLDEIYRRLDDYGTRLTRVEEKVLIANGDIKTLQALIKAQEDNITIKSWRPLDDKSGYVLTMSDGNTIVLKNGADGASSNIGVKRATDDGLLYWTMNGAFMYDEHGNKIRAQGVDGAPGITPQLRIERGYWEYSLDGKNWHLVLDANFAPVKANGENIEEVLDIKETSTHIVITFKGQVFVISKTGAGSGTGGDQPINPQKPAPRLEIKEEKVTLYEKSTYTLEVELDPKEFYKLDDIEWSSSAPKIVSVEKGVLTALAPGEADITAKIGTQEVTVYVVVEKLLKIKLEVTDIKAITAKINITPDDETATYFASCMQMSLWEQQMGKRIPLNAQEVFEKIDKPLFESVSTTPEAWRNVIPTYLDHGKHTYTPLDYGTEPRPGMELIVYAYGLNNQGEITGELVYKIFKLNDSKVDPNFTFEIEVKEVTSDAVIATITPSKKDMQYAITLQQGSYATLLKMYLDSTDPEKKAKLQDMLYDRAQNKATLKKKGDYTIGKTDFTPRRRNTEQLLVVFGYDEENGITSVVKYITVKTKDN